MLPVVHDTCLTTLTRAAISVVLDVDVNWVPKVAAELLRLLLSEGISSDNYS